MSQPFQDPGSTLATELITSLLGQSAALAGQAHNLLFPVAHARNELRNRLLAEGQIIRLDTLTPMPQVSLAAVDGGSVRQHLYAADLMVAVGASAEGLISTGNLPLAHRHWTQVIEHESENDRLLSAAMASLELCVIAELTHGIRILDGSYGTPVIAFSTALAARSTRVAEAATALVTEEVVHAIDGLAAPDLLANPGEIVALPKADSSHAFSDRYRTDYDLDLPGGDRFLAAQILQPGEMLYPRSAPELAGMHFTVRDDSPRMVKAAAERLGAAITPIRDAASDRQILVTYVKPATADTVVKIETRVSESLPKVADPTSVAAREVARIARLISDETPGPHMQEPFCQYMVDLAAKSVSVGAEALNASMLNDLPEGSDGYATWLARSYRTQSGGGGSTRPGSAIPRPGQPGR